MSTEDKCQGSASSTSENDITKSKRINAADNTASDNDHFTFSNDCTLEEMRKILSVFISERNWDQFHEPRNVLLALVGEVGELSEIFQWKGEVKRDYQVGLKKNATI
ncbi:hypothetical protein LSH36_214g02023 [Paralvinella palmiformis]|uniref:Uncharacterized protein n=1 Tax=Paralvinella palmiformis TaxID=53620 RepID=A0AAD9N433_9ANNE|nr:hypothetical protein LSH36_214g02023 [Paralvinella palmiformis]